jgi:hypothetical protein
MTRCGHGWSSSQHFDQFLQPLATQHLAFSVFLKSGAVAVSPRHHRLHFLASIYSSAAVLLGLVRGI